MAYTSESELTELDLPEFGMPTTEPNLDAETYRCRLNRLAERARENSYDTFVVYGDREHFANLTYLTGYDPRFEESLLVLDITARDAPPTLIVGNEGEGYVDVSPIADELTIRRYGSFSLLGQARGENDLVDILRETGVRGGTTVGVAGWKYFTPAEVSNPEITVEIPSYIVDTLRELSGDPTRVRNATALLMDSEQGMRATSSIDQLARFEFAACHTSQAVRDVIFGVEPGMTEHEAVQLMDLSGLPLSCHLMLSSGPRAQMGLPSPSTRTIERGNPFTIAYGARGALNSRAGFLVADADELPAEINDYGERLVRPYFEAIAAWYERIGIGVAGHELYDTVHDRIGDSFFGVELNPGHLIHLDEWVDSPVYKGSTETLQSGMTIQMDVIPATDTPYFMTNAEDGVALADEPLRMTFADAYPEAWKRIQHRREFMREVLGIDLAPEVLPFSNIPAYLPPYLCSPERAMKIM